MSQGENTNNEMSFIDHLEELRWHLIRSGIAILVITIIVFICNRFIFDTLILGPKSADFLTYKGFCKLSHLLGLGNLLCIQPGNFKLVNIEVTGQFMTHLKVSLVLGIIIAFPYVLWEIWRFIKPGLHEHEQKHTRGFVFVSSLLFFIGVSFGYLVLSPFSINFFATYSVSAQINNTITLTSYISIITTLVLASGIMFELPLIVYFLSNFGLLTPDLMREYRKHAFVVILFIAAIITPADVWTQILVTVPVYFLYELSIGVSARVVKRLEKQRGQAIQVVPEGK